MLVNFAVERFAVASAPPSQHHHARHRARPAHVVRQPELRVLDLTLAALPAELAHALVDHAHSGRADRVAERLEPPARVDRLLAPDARLPFLDRLPTLTLFVEAQVLD